MFNTEEQALRAFRFTDYDECDVEQCGVCNQWTASRADHPDGGIVGPACDDDGDCLVDRICEYCDAIPIDEIKELISPKDLISPTDFNQQLNQRTKK